MEKVLSRWDNYNSRELFYTMIELSLFWIFEIQNLLRILLLIDVLIHFLPFWLCIWKDRLS